MKVLIIDDDEGVRDTFSRALQNARFDVTAVGGTVAAFAELQHQTFDGIVCDVILPVADGTSFYEELVVKFPSMAPRVLFVSGWTDDEKVTRLLEYTGQPYLAKPVELADLVKAVWRVVDRAVTAEHKIGTA